MTSPPEVESDMTKRRPRKRRRKGKRGKPRVPAIVLDPVEGTEWGPAMAALPSDRHRAFVLGLYQVKRGHGAQVRAAKLAGFGTTASSAKSWSVIASRLAHDERIQAALFEEDQKRIRASAPRAIRALGRLVETPNHRDHCRAIGMVLDRVHPTQTALEINVEHRHRHELVSPEKVLERIRELAASAGVEMPRLPPPATIDGTFKDITPMPGEDSA